MVGSPQSSRFKPQVQEAPQEVSKSRSSSNPFDDDEEEDQSARFKSFEKTFEQARAPSNPFNDHEEEEKPMKHVDAVVIHVSFYFPITFRLQKWINSVFFLLKLQQ